MRDWLYVEDHARALYTVVSKGTVGDTYNIGGHNERRNLQVVETICDLLNELAPPQQNPNLSDRQLANYRKLIAFVADRPGHDLRYAIDAGKIEHELGWAPEETFESGIRKTVAWYLANRDWCQRAQAGKYSRERLGAGGAA